MVNHHRVVSCLENQILFLGGSHFSRHFLFYPDVPPVFYGSLCRFVPHSHNLLEIFLSIPRSNVDSVETLSVRMLTLLSQFFLSRLHQIETLLSFVFVVVLEIKQNPFPPPFLWICELLEPPQLDYGISLLVLARH